MFKVRFSELTYNIIIIIVLLFICFMAFHINCMQQVFGQAGYIRPFEC